MTISSRTPEGVPHRCPVCGKVAALEPSYPGGDSICPTCGQLLWWFRDRLGQNIELQTRFRSGWLADSLDVVELMMELEEQFHVSIPLEEAERIQTIEDAIRVIEKYLSEDAG
jgi:acyl carrier protein